MKDDTDEEEGEMLATFIFQVVKANIDLNRIEK